jgi:transcriptional regulator of acetoin/glycerol metabolism
MATLPKRSSRRTRKKKRSHTTYILPLRQAKKAAILSAVKQLDGNVSLAAEKLEIAKTTLYRKLKEYGLTSKRLRRKGNSV